VPDSLEAFKDDLLGRLGTDILDSKVERDRLQDEIDDLGARIRGMEESLDQFCALCDLSTNAMEQLDEASRRRKRRRDLEGLQNKQCAVTGVLYQECMHVREWQDRLRLTSVQDAHWAEQSEAKEAEARERAEQGKGELQRQLGDLREQLRVAKNTRSDRLAGIGQKQSERDAVDACWDSHCEWLTKLNQPGGYEELDATRKALADNDKDIAATEKRLGELLQRHDDNRTRLQDIFSASVRAVLASGSYDGAVGLENRELSFVVTHGPAMSGEAVETLSVLLSDLACQVYNSISEDAYLPGLLVHDSPREADLGQRIYRSSIRFAAALQSHFVSADACPFQYILTTTTSPPKDLQGPAYVKLWLNAATSDGLLLGQNIADATEVVEEGDLLEEEEEPQ
jgi:hypothetical protein